MAASLIYDPCALTDDEPIEQRSWLAEDVARSKRFAWLEEETIAEETASDGLSVARGDIEFANSAKNVVAIEVRVANRSPRRSARTRMVLQAAPFGAFVPWQRLATLDVPALEPGEARTVRTSARVPQARPLGEPARVPPTRLLTALGLGDLGDQPPRRRRKKRAADAAAGTGTLPADAMQLLRHGSSHWMGNLNVLVGKVDVERHLARALRVVPGRVNVAMFVVGSYRPDAYAFHLNEQGRDWQATLYDMTSMKSLVLNVADAPAIAPEQWVESTGSCVMTLRLRPPRGCKAGNVEVHVTQRSTGREAVVEFSLDPKAAGPGCYVVG